MDLKKGYDKTLKNTSCRRGFAENCLVVDEDCADYLSNNMRLNEIFIPTFFLFYCNLKRSQSEIVVKATYGLHSN